MQISNRFAFVALALAVAVSQASAKTQDLGVLTSSGKTFGNSFFSNTANFTDYYTFSIANDGGVTGGIRDTSFFFLLTRDVQLTSLKLIALTSATVLATDLNASSFTFNGLGAGDYKLAVTGSVWGIGGIGGYGGSMKAIAAPVPEASDMALTAVGLSGVVFMVRRRKAV